MNTSMYRQSAVALLAVACVFSSAGLQAQEKKAKIVKEEKVIIKKRGDKTEKTTIVIDGDNVTINGKPASEYKGDVSVKLDDPELDIAFDYDTDLNEAQVWAKGYPAMPALPSLPAMPGMPAMPPMPPAVSIGPDFNNNDFYWSGESKPMLGVYTEKDEKGARITNVVDDSPAQKAGLQKGDIITKIDGVTVTDPSSLSSIINNKKPDEEIQVVYLRDKKEKKLKLKLGERKEEFARSFNFNAPKFSEDFSRNFKIEGDPFFNNRPRLGLRIQDTEEGNGVKVIELEDSSAAAKSGILKDDIITNIDGADIKNTDDARGKMADVKDKSSYPVKVLRNGAQVTVEIKIPKKLKTTDL